LCIQLLAFIRQFTIFKTLFLLVGYDSIFNINHPKIMAKSVSDQLVEMLVQTGIKRIYAVTGDSLNEVNDAVRREGSIQWIHVRHEEAGAYAAGAEAQLNGIACCAGSSGPGHVHLINGLYDAHKSGASVIAIASTVASSEFGSDYFQETNTIKLFDDCSYYNQIATTPKQLPRMLQAAIQTALHRKGVAVVGLPGDLAKMDAEDIESKDTGYGSLLV
jgi:pyruvate dehydrogenase (quinone)